MVNSTRQILLDSIASILIERAVGDPDWFADLDQVLRKRKYRFAIDFDGCLKIETLEPTGVELTS